MNCLNFLKKLTISFSRTVPWSWGQNLTTYFECLLGAYVSDMVNLEINRTYRIIQSIK